MNATTAAAPSGRHYELRFASLFDAGRGYAFPCDAEGRVDMDHMSPNARNHYFFARSVIGRDLATPRVQLAD